MPRKSVPYLERYGLDVLKNGYEITPIAPGSKRPVIDDWRKKRFGTKGVRNWSEKGKGNYGIGVKTALTPAVDIDCYDEELVADVREFTFELCGEAPSRIGQPPKELLLYRAEESFPKVQSRTYIDDEGRLVKCEILADGQQFVALHIHPDTKKPFRWEDKIGPHNTPVSNLPTINREQAQQIADFFDREVKARHGWLRKETAQRMDRNQNVDDDDPFVEDAQKIELSTEEVRSKLMLVPNPEDYDQWFYVGMALHHQFDGEEEGLLLWHEWSVDAPNYDMDALDEKWPTFDIENKRRQPLTARYILKQAKDAEEKLQTEQFEDLRYKLGTAKDVISLQEVANEVKQLPFNDTLRETLAQTAKAAITRITKLPGTIANARRMVRFENTENTDKPAWMRPFVYVQLDETFYNRKTRTPITKAAFNASFDRYMLTKRDRLEGQTVPEHHAADLALNRSQIAVVANKMYMPGEGDLFEVNNERYVNSYTDVGVPDEIEEDDLTPEDRNAIRLVEAHFDHVIAREFDREMLKDFLSYIVRTMGRVNWCPILQGQEGDGKTVFLDIMGSVLGAENVNTIPGEALAEKNTAWAEGSLFTLVEEVRLHGTDRFAVINKVKPYITNSIASIRRMNNDWYKVINRTSYMMVTNYQDGVPIGENDTRYFPILSRWQTKKAIDQFKFENPFYYSDLFEAIHGHASALRWWLLNRKMGKAFDPKERAPESSYRAEVAFLTQSDDEEIFQHIMDDADQADLTNTLLDQDVLIERMFDENGNAPTGKTMKMFLTERGFSFVGSLVMGGKRRKLWSQVPDRFKDERGNPLNRRVTQWLQEYDDTPL